MKQTQIRIFGLVTGFLLFAASFAILLNGVFFNSAFYKYAFKEFGVYDSISDLAGDPARELSSKVSLAPGIDTSLITENISGNMVRVNTDALVYGLIQYFSGKTNSLPDLSLSGLSAFKNINLQVLMMCTGESRITNIFILISLVQYVLVYIPFLLLLLLPIILMYMLNKSAAEIKKWVFSSAFTYCVLSIAAAVTIQLAPAFLYKSGLSGAGLLLPSLSPMLMKLITFFANVLTIYLLLSGTFLYTGIVLSEKLIWKVSSLGNAPWGITEIALYCQKNKKVILVITAIIISGTVYTSASIACREFEDRDLGQKLSLLWENNPLYHCTDARNEQVYLLEIHAVDSDSKPVSHVGLRIVDSGNDPAPSQNYGSVTDQEGYATFLLDKGSYSLYVGSYDMVSLDSDPFKMPVNLSCLKLQPLPFQLSIPGKSILNLTLDRNDNGLLNLADASLQYMP